MLTLTWAFSLNDVCQNRINFITEARSQLDVQFVACYRDKILYRHTPDISNANREYLDPFFFYWFHCFPENVAAFPFFSSWDSLFSIRYNNSYLIEKKKSKTSLKFVWMCVEKPKCEQSTSCLFTKRVTFLRGMPNAYHVLKPVWCLFFVGSHKCAYPTNIKVISDRVNLHFFSPVSPNFPTASALDHSATVTHFH